jgi:hypothetical protein
MKKQFVICMLFLLGIFGGMLSVSAQTENDSLLIEIRGVLSYQDINGDGLKQIVVDSMVVQPPPGFNSGDFPVGALVSVIGFLQSDNTLQANSMSIIVEQADPPPDDNDIGGDRGNGNRGKGNNRNLNADETIITGVITEVNPNYIMVNSVLIEGGNTFRPRNYEVGEWVIVTGTFKNNGRLRSDEIDIISTRDVDTICISESHPVVVALVTEFDAKPKEVVELHCEGYGFGTIARALILAQATNKKPKDYLNQFDDGLGWGQIFQEAGYSPSEFSQGRAIGQDG